MRTLSDLRRFTVSRSLFPATTLKNAIEQFGFVQADPIRSPARAQDLTLRPRVKGYRAGDLEAHYATLLSRKISSSTTGSSRARVQALMHPRASPSGRPAAEQAREGHAGVRARTGRRCIRATSTRILRTAG